MEDDEDILSLVGVFSNVSEFAIVDELKICREERDGYKKKEGGYQFEILNFGDAAVSGFYIFLFCKKKKFS